MSLKTFIRNVNVSSVAFTRLTGIINLFASERELSKGSKLKDKFWLCGKNAGSNRSTANSNNLPG